MIVRDIIQEKRISKARTQLLFDEPFIGNIAMNMDILLDDEVPTACTNGDEIRFNPKWIATLSDLELKFLVAHEVFHPMFEHCWRKKDKEPQKWNIACDYVINWLLVKEKVGIMPKIGLYSDEIYKEGQGISELIYNNLPDVDETDPQFGGEGQPLDDIQDNTKSEAEREQKKTQWKIRIAQSAQASKIMGKLSATMERLVGELLETKVDWREVLQRFVEKCRADTRSFERLNRRFISQGLVLPSVSGESLGEIAIAVDCSGSINQSQLNQFASEVITIWQDLRPKKIHVIYFDSQVSHVDEYDRDNEPSLTMHGGGGTAFSPVFKYMQEKDIDPVACVFLTDLYCDDFGNIPDYPVLWVSTDERRDSVPFGEVVYMNDVELSQASYIGGK
tara:strand:+ start:740 stop:1912 length:1173 start_codon:yes stop_codon:yes gene_type:complete